MSDIEDVTTVAAELAEPVLPRMIELEPAEGLRASSGNARRARERVIEGALLTATVISGAIIILVIVFVALRAAPLMSHQGLSFLWRGGWDRGLEDAWTNPKSWNFGAFPLIMGTLITTVGSVALAAAVGTPCAIFLAFLAPEWIGRPVEAVVRLLSGIPSVVFGLIGLSVVVPWIQATFVSNQLSNKYAELALNGQCLMAALAVLTFMILPFFVTVATDSLRAVPKSYRLGGLALGLNEWRTITKLIIPPAIPGLVAGLVLASARAIGEAIAISMVAGAMANIPNVAHGFVFFLEPIRTMASAIVENAEGMDVPHIEATLFGLATILLMFSLLLSLAARAAFGAFSRKMHFVSHRTV